MRKEYKVVVTDASCFIILSKIGAINLLNNLFTTVLTTPEVASECGFPLPGWVSIKSADPFLQKKFNQHVDLGEASAIALASGISCDFLILDDSEARKFAEKLGLNVKGSIGLILSAKQNGLITSIRPYLNLIQQTNFRVSISIIQAVLKAAGED